MENASKALLMAGGILLTMLIVMLLFFFRNRIVEFYDEQDKIDDIANISEFNKQFTNYERDKVYGYEIISLANMIEDYNSRHSNAEGAKNDEKYNPITLNVSFQEKWADVEGKIWYDSLTSTRHLFVSNNKVLTQSSTQNEIVNTIKTVTGYERIYGNTDIATKLAKSIKLLIIDKTDDEGQINNLMNTRHIEEDEAIEILQKQAVDNYKAITKTNENLTYNQMESRLLNTANIKQYYEYYQLKKAIFKCTNVTYYNDVGGTGRVKSLNFEFTGVVE